MNTKKKTTIRARIVRLNAISMAVALCLVGIGASLISFSAGVGQSRRSFVSIVSTAAVAVEMEMSATKGIIQELGMNTTLYDPTVSKAELTNYLRNKASQYGFEAIYATNTKGINNTGYDLSEYDFFKAAMRGENYFSEPMLTADGGSAQIMVSAPIWKDGVYGGEIKGAVCAVIDGSALSNMVRRANIGETGGLYIINHEGYTIADVDYNVVLNRENSIKEAKFDGTLKAFAEADSAAIRGESVFDTVKYNDKSQFLYVMPLGNTGWAIGGMAHSVEHVGSYLYVCIGTVVASIILMVAAYFVASSFAWKISRPVVAMTEASKRIAQGDYNIDIDCNSNDELGEMAENFRVMASHTRAVIEDTRRGLEAIADGNFTVCPRAEYLGVFADIKDAMGTIVGTLGNTVRGIRDASDQVNVGATQVAEAASSLSQGATEQAAAVEELVATTHQLAEQVKDNAVASQTAQEQVGSVRIGIEQSNERMQNLNEAMHTISQRSNEIHNIIKLIDDIAFQTNILALNAAVEAARAGQAGKGFSVVADEVRSLASKSASSVQEITVLIEAIGAAIKDGAKIADETAEALRTVVGQTMSAVEMMDAINAACSEQSDRLAETNSGIEQIAEVVQSNSAVAEQSAAASEELASQADLLQKELAKFKV